jgi:hypothetical protein
MLYGDTDDSYVSREKALEGGLAFWTNDGIPGIQVSSHVSFQSSRLPTSRPTPQAPSLIGRSERELMTRRSIGPHSLSVRTGILSESLLTLYTLVDCS